MTTRQEIRNSFASAHHDSDASLILEAIICSDYATPGDRRQAVILLEIAPQHRLEARMEGRRLCNTTPGWRPSDALWAASRKFV